MKRLSYFLFSILLIAALPACKDDDGGGSGNNPNNPPSNLANPHVSGTTVQADFLGRITDQEQNPVSGALVQIGGAFAQTDNDGFYSIENASVDSRFSTIQVQAGNHYDQYRNVRPKTGEVNLVDIRLIPRTFNGFFQANAGGEVEVEGGGSVVFPANGMVDEEGNAYSGQVIVAATYLDPTDMALATYMPGSSAAVDEDGMAVGMISYGMIGVDILSSGGQPLQLADGALAQIEFPVQEEQTANAPDQIPLWHFDEASGVWREEGSAVREGNMYSGEVSHFSFWNCDIAVETVYLDMAFYDEQSGASLSNLYLRLYRPDGTYSNGFTNAEGEVSGIVPSNEVLTVEVYNDDCGTDLLLYSEDIGPFSDDASLDPIGINLPDGYEVISFAGTIVDCEGEPISNALLLSESTETSGSQYAVADENGAFDFSYTCATQGEVEYLFQNLDDLSASETFTIDYDVLNETEYNLGEVVFCESFSLETFLTYEDGQNSFAYGFGSSSGDGECLFLTYQLPDSTSQSDYGTIAMVYPEGTGITGNCWGDESIYLSRVLPNGNQLYTNFIDAVITVTSFDEGPDGVEFIVGTVTGSSQVSILNAGTEVESYTAEATVNFQLTNE
ncbi:MAG: carboxypeptidase-like regulatory domain-containing protein [Cryomorphaceae bacterium]